MFKGQKTIKALVCLMAVCMMVFGAFSIAMAEDITVSGMVQKAGDAYSLQAADKTYTLEGDVASFEGKNVEVTGEVAGDVLKVKDIKEVQ